MTGTETSSRIRSRFTEASTASEVLEGVNLTGKTAIVTALQPCFKRLCAGDESGQSV